MASFILRAYAKADEKLVLLGVNLSRNGLVALCIESQVAFASNIFDAIRNLTMNAGGALNVIALALLAAEDVYHV